MVGKAFVGLTKNKLDYEEVLSAITFLMPTL
jgi:hypothetical protein